MTFENLPTIAQDFLIYQNNQFSKAFWLFSFIAFSLIYVLVWKRYVEQPTPYFSVAFARIFITAFSVIFLIASPIFVLMMYPGTSFDSLFLVLFGFYSIALTIFFVGLMADSFYFGTLIWLRMANIDKNNRRVNEVYKRWFKKDKFIQDDRR